MAHGLQCLETEAAVLIDERKPLGTHVLLDLDILERELEKGVVIERKRRREDRAESFLGGLVTEEEHVEVDLDD